MLAAFALLLLTGGIPESPAAAMPGEAAPEGAGGPFRPRILLQVRVEAARLPDRRRLHELESEVQAIWNRHLDLAFAWPGDLTTSGLSDRLELVMTDRLPANGAADALGWIEFLAPERPDRTIHVSLAAAYALSAQARWPTASGLVPASLRERFVTRALARSIAHELGHYLLRSASHTDRGLMRSHFTAAEIAEARPLQFQLSAHERAALETRLLQYARATLRGAAAASPC